MKISYKHVYQNINETIRDDSKKYSDDYFKVDNSRNIIMTKIMGLCYEVEEHWHEWVEFIYVNEGNITINYLNKHVVLSSHDFIMIPSGTLHSLEIDKNDFITNLLINSNYIKSLYPWYDITNIECNTLECHNIETYHNYNKLLDIYKMMVHYFYSKNKEDQLAFYGYFQLFLHNLYQNFQVKNGPTSLHKNDTKEINYILTYIHNHYKENINQKTLAETMSISPQYLSRILKKNIGMTFMQYVTDLKLNQGSYELQFTEKSITEIVYDCGFANHQSFNREFKKRYNMLPNEYRKHHKG